MHTSNYTALSLSKTSTLATLLQFRNKTIDFRVIVLYSVISRSPNMQYKRSAEI